MGKQLSTNVEDLHLRFTFSEPKPGTLRHLRWALTLEEQLPKLILSLRKEAVAAQKLVIKQRKTRGWFCWSNGPHSPSSAATTLEQLNQLTTSLDMASVGRLLDFLDKVASPATPVLPSPASPPPPPPAQRSPPHTPSDSVCGCPGMTSALFTFARDWRRRSLHRMRDGGDGQDVPDMQSLSRLQREASAIAEAKKQVRIQCTSRGTLAGDGALMLALAELGEAWLKKPFGCGKIRCFEWKAPSAWAWKALTWPCVAWEALVATNPSVGATERKIKSRDPCGWATGHPAMTPISLNEVFLQLAELAYQFPLGYVGDMEPSLSSVRSRVWNVLAALSGTDRKSVV